MLLVVTQSIRLPIIASMFEVKGGSYGISALTNPKSMTGVQAASDLFFKMGSGSVTCLALVEYAAVLFPVLGEHKQLAATAVLTLFYIIGAVGDKFAAKVQNLMVILMYVALAIFVVYGLMNYDPASYAGEPLFMNGFTSFMMAVALMSYTCNGFQYVINMGEAAENPKRDIPLAFFLSAFVAAGIYALIGFSATHAFSYGQTAGQNLGNLAELMMPPFFYNFFVVGGAIFALATSLLGGIASGYRPIQASARDGWFPKVLAEESKLGVPYIYFALYVLSLIPILSGIPLDNMATMSLVPSGILGVITNAYSMKVPERFPEQWAERKVKMSVSLYRLLLVLSCLASVILTAYCFVSNDFKLTVTVITIVIFAYGIIRGKSDKITIRAKEEFKEKA